jgi:hypothetical protein
MTASFTALPSGVDADTAELIVSMPLASDEEVTHWFGLVQDAYDAGPEDADTERFAQRLRETAGSLDPTGLDQFTYAVQGAGDGLRVVSRMLEVRTQLPGLYWELYWQRYPADQAAGEATGEPAEVAYAEHAEEPAEDGGRFGWVGAQHQERLAAAWGPEWSTYLAQQLDYRWGEAWDASPADHKQSWLDGLIDELMTPATEPVIAETPAAEGTEKTATEGAAAGEFEEVELDQLAEMLVADTVAEIEGADGLSAEDLAEVTAAVRNNILEEMAND